MPERDYVSINNSYTEIFNFAHWDNSYRITKRTEFKSTRENQHSCQKINSCN